MSKNKNSSFQQKVYLEAFVLFIINILIFSLTFLASFYLLKNKLHMQAVDLPLLKGGFDYSGLDMIVMIKTWAPIIGVSIGVSFSVILLILMLIFTKLRRKSKITGLILYLITLLGFGSLAYDILYLEPRSTAIFSAVKSFIGVPFGYGLIALVIFCAIWFLIKKFSGAVTTVIAIFCLFSFGGCNLTSSSDIACEIYPDSDHCFQQLAIQSGDSNDCDKIQGKGFQGQNPPKDKCYLMSAISSGKYELCDKIQGGFTSYTKEQCMMEVAVSKKDMEQCKKLQAEGAEVDCESKIPTEGENPLKANEIPVAKVSKIDGDVRIIKEDGRVIPLTKDSILGPNDRISSLDDSSFTIEINGQGIHSVPPNTMLLMNHDLDTLEEACAAVAGIR